MQIIKPILMPRVFVKPPALLAHQLGMISHLLKSPPSLVPGYTCISTYSWRALFPT